MGFPKELAKAKKKAVAWDNYVAYLSNLDEQQANVGNGTPKPPQTALYLKPFGLDLDTDQYLQANGTTSRWTSFGSLFSAYTKADINEAGGEIFLKLRNVKPAKITIKLNVNPTGTVATSKSTQLKYLNYGGNSGSLPFGRGSTTNTETEVYQELRDAILSGGAPAASTRFARQKEKV